MTQTGTRLVKVLVALSVPALLGACATTQQPSQVVTQLDTKHPKYQTQECQQARQSALAYDDNVSGRVGLGIGLGLFLGPLGIPIALAADASQAEKRDAVLIELRRHCEGELEQAVQTSTVPDAQKRLEALQEMRSKALITDAEYEAKRAQVLNSVIAEAPKAPVSAVGETFRVEDIDPVTRRPTLESVLRVDSIGSEEIVLNGGSTALSKDGDLKRGALPLPHIAGLASGRLAPGATVKATFIPPGAGNPVPVSLRVVGTENLAFGGGLVSVARCRLQGNATSVNVPPVSFAVLGASMSGDVLVEPTTGLVLQADVRSEHFAYAFQRRLLRR